MKQWFFLCASLLCLLPELSAQNCPPNIDFENGTFSGWQCFTGQTYTNGNQNVIQLNPSPPTPGQHEIISAATAGLDRYGGFPTLCPYGGNYSVKLGNNYSGAEAEGLSYTFQIPASVDTFSLTYYYAVVFEDPNHASYQQPRFFVTAYEVSTGALINCASYNYVSTSSLPGFEVSTVNNSVLYRNWTPASIDFSGLAGKTVRIEFKTADCTLGGHFGYAYVDVGTDCGGLIVAASLCGSTNSVQLSGPYGFKDYTWYNADYSVVVGNQQNVILTPPPPANTLFHVDMVPFPGFGCRDTADATVIPAPVPDTPIARSFYQYCQFQQATALTATASPGHDLLWYTTPTGGTAAAIPITPSTQTAGLFKYYVAQRKPFGCESPRKEILVNVTPLPTAAFSINGSTQCFKTQDFIFTNTSSNVTDSTVYSWNLGDGTISQQQQLHHVYANAGNYTVKLKVFTPPGCSHEISQTIKVAPNPVARAEFPASACENQTPITLKDVSYVPSGGGPISNWEWWTGSTVLTGQNPAPFLSAPGSLTVRQVVKTTDGCLSDTNTFTIAVHYRPLVQFSHSTLLCNNEPIRFTDKSALPREAAPDIINTWNWQFNNAITVTEKEFSIQLNAGPNRVTFFSETNMGCRSEVADSMIMINEKPVLGLTINDSCINRLIEYQALNLGGAPASKWFWDFGTGLRQGPSRITNRYPYTLSLPIRLLAYTDKGCKDTLFRRFAIYKNDVITYLDTTAAIDQPVELNVGGGPGYQYNWSPATGLSSTVSGNPVATLDKDQLYELKSLSPQGCDAYSKIRVKRYAGPELFIPNAFTPNGDGRNDILRVFPVGIKVFNSFRIFNRMGVCLFHTSNASQGWDGTYKGVRQDPGTFVFVAEAITYTGKKIIKKGTVILIR